MVATDGAFSSVGTSPCDEPTVRTTLTVATPCGLGLPIVQSIARLHGGNVAIVSLVGQGTKVTLTLSSG
ncbi:MAG: HAMP domain-containing histidine kinase [Acidobacteria bacterium]|nr:MAG: HAMP domain-containing histidine kinase [Acidobacteriota bacterium]